MSNKNNNIKSNLPLLAVVAVAACAIVLLLVNRSGVSDENNNADNAANIGNTVISGVTQDESGNADSEVNEGNTFISDEAWDENDVADTFINETVTITLGESLTILTADITSDASFFPLEVDGTEMEVIAVKASDGNIRTAFNTCQVCYGSGRGYYVQSGDYLVCQNCGNRFSMDQVEVESGGCNPWPIFDENKTVTEDEILISYDFLVEAQGIFANWKSNY